MNYNKESPEVITKKGQFFDFTLKSGHPIIMDYSLMNREIVVAADGVTSLGIVKKKEKISSIHVLRRIFDEIVSDVQVIINRNGVYNIGINLEDDFMSTLTIESPPFRVYIEPEDRALIIDQMIFDVLCDKYLAESPQMTLQQYSFSHSRYILGDVTDSKLLADTVRKCVKAAILRQTDIMDSPALRADIEKLGVKPDKYFAYLNELNNPFVNTDVQKTRQIVTKPKIIWDYIYYSGTHKLITGKQYMRSFSNHENYSRKAVAELFDTYDKFVKTVFMHETENSRDYFHKSIDFFYLEIYKRIDFIYKLACRLDCADAPTINKNHALVKRFHPEVLGFYADNDRPVFGTKFNYYRPMLMLEEAWQEEMRYNKPIYPETLQKYHLIRAKVYELFKYHYQFVSDSYNEISDFIREHYNILSYHEPEKIWIQDDREHKAEREVRIIKALEINEALFGDSGKRESKTRIRSNDSNK